MTVTGVAKDLAGLANRADLLGGRPEVFNGQRGKGIGVVGRVLAIGLARVFHLPVGGQAPGLARGLGELASVLMGFVPGQRRRREACLDPAVALSVFAATCPSVPWVHFCATILTDQMKEGSLERTT